MRWRGSLCAVAALAALVCPAAAPAHHSFAMFDNSRAITLTGTVQKFQWTNPHGYLEMTTAAGKYFTLEMTSPNMMSRAGWSSRTVKVGDHVTALVSPLRNGQPGGLLLEVKLPDGRTMVNPVPNAQNYKRTP